MRCSEAQFRVSGLAASPHTFAAGGFASWMAPFDVAADQRAAANSCTVCVVDTC